MTEPVIRPTFRAARDGEHYRVDGNGVYIEPVVLYAGEMLPPDVVAEPFPNTLSRPRWTGAEWVENRSDYEMVDQLKASAVARAKARAGQDMAAQYPDSQNWVVDFTLDFGAGKRPETDQRMRAVNIIRARRDRFIAAARAKTTPQDVRRMRWEDEGTW